jgi:uncharacterized membrane protein HdeD (DUF308 family)
MTRYWWVVLVVGVAWLVVAWVVLRADVRSLAAVGVLIGIVLVMAGVDELSLGTMMRGGWKALHYVLGVLLLLGGLWGFIRPINTFFALASVLGLVLVFLGAAEVARGVASRGEDPYWWVGLASGVLLLLLAFWVSSSDPAATIARRTYLILFWVGFMALLRGITSLVLGFSLRHLGTVAARAEAHVVGGLEAASVVPPQERRGVEEPAPAAGVPGPEPRPEHRQ